MKLALAVCKKRTSVYWGTNHYCVKHKQLTDYKHIDECDQINDQTSKITEWTLPLDEVESLWDLEHDCLLLLITRLQGLQNKINKLVEER